MMGKKENWVLVIIASFLVALGLSSIRVFVPTSLFGDITLMIVGLIISIIICPILDIKAEACHFRNDSFPKIKEEGKEKGVCDKVLDNLSPLLYPFRSDW